MNMQTTVKVRKGKGQSGQPVGEHLTLTRVSNDQAAGRVFAFAMKDDGEEVYIPGGIVTAHQMTQHDADYGATFYAPLRPNPRALAEGNTAQWIITNPLVWDSDEEEIVVDMPGTSNVDVDVLETEFGRLAEAADDMVTDASDQIGKMSIRLKQCLSNANASLAEGAKLVQEMSDVAKKLTSFRAYIDEMAPSDGD